MSRFPPVIAVVDDEDSVRRALHRLLRSAGFEVAVFASGEEFLRSLDQATPSCVVLDLHMPGTNGFDVQETLKRDQPHLPVVIITGYDTSETKARVMQQGTAAYLSKPVDAMVLLAAINAAIGGGIDAGRARDDTKKKPPDGKP